MKRSRLRGKGRKPSNRDAHKADREEYRLANPLCEWGCGRPATEVDHIVQKSGGTYELIENYFATDRRCHDAKHAGNLRSKQIEIKRKKGEWMSDEEQLRIFGKIYC